ncbi:hypothetical protein ACA910_008583 [Epithemia clementina (nom. ined.)]
MTGDPKGEDTFQDENDVAVPEDLTETGMSDMKKSYDEGVWSVSAIKPYKREMISNEIANNEPGDERRAAVINALRDLGVKVFIIEAKSIETTSDILHHIHRVIDYVSRENQMFSLGQLDENGEHLDPLGFQRCLLYQDRSGRLFNLVIAQHAVGPASKFEELMDSFKGVEAMVALTVLCRSFSCVMNDANLDLLEPARLSLILGLVFSEELGLSYTFAQMFVRATPSISAHTLTTFVGSDLLRKAVILLLAVAGGASDRSTRGYVTVAGISLACALFLANLGSRAWRYMGWKPFPYQGPFSGPLAWLAAVLTGCIFPFMGHRKVHVGGRPAMEHVISTAIIVAIIFMASDIDSVQRFLVVGSENCNQDYVNIIVGGWWTFTFISSILMVMAIPYDDYNITPAEPEDEEQLLVHDHASPVGYKVPNLPDFELDPSLAGGGVAPACPLSMMSFCGIFLAIIFGGGMVYLGLIDEDDDFWTRQLL